MQKRKLPPYGKPLFDLIQSNQRPQNDIYLFIGKDAWNRGQISSISRPTRTLVLPPSHLPLGYYWPVNQCSILLIDTGISEMEYIEEIAFQLFKDGAESIYAISTPHEKFIAVYKKEFCND